MEREKKLVLLLEYTKLQSSALQNNNMDEFLKLIEKRQILMDEIDTYKEAYTEKETSILNEIIYIEGENNMLFVALYNETKDILKNIRKHRKLHKAYMPYKEQLEEGIFYDKRSEGI